MIKDNHVDFDSAIPRFEWPLTRDFWHSRKWRHFRRLAAQSPVSCAWSPQRGRPAVLGCMRKQHAGGIEPGGPWCRRSLGSTRQPLRYHRVDPPERGKSSPRTVHVRELAQCTRCQSPCAGLASGRVAPWRSCWDDRKGRGGVIQSAFRLTTARSQLSEIC